MQATPQRWAIESLAGLEGRIALQLLPHLPMMRELFNPSDLRFLKISHFFYAPGQERFFFRLLEGVMYRHRQKLAIAYLDPRSPVNQALRHAGRLGILNPLLETPVKVFADVSGLQPAEITDLASRPLVISPLDH